MSRRKKGSYFGGQTILTQRRGDYEAEMVRAAQRAKRRAEVDQKRHDVEKQQQVQRRLDELTKFAPRPSPPGSKMISSEELKQKYPEGLPQWMLGHSADEVDRLMQLRRKRMAVQKASRRKQP
jgi:hypothetical protein